MRAILLSALIGTVLGYLGARVLFVGSYLSLIPWGIAGFILGWWSQTYRTAGMNGAVYGFVLAFFFMLVGYEGSSPVWTRIPFFALLGLVGAVCGAGLGLGGAWLSHLTGKARG